MPVRKAEDGVIGVNGELSLHYDLDACTERQYLTVAFVHSKRVQ